MIKNLFIFGSSIMSALCLGYFIGSKTSKKKIASCGNLRLDSSEADEPVKIFFEVTNEKELFSADYVTLKVIKENYVSHKKESI